MILGKLSLRELSLWGNPSDKVLGLVTKTKFHLKIMKYVANLKKCFRVLRATPRGFSKNIDLGLEKPLSNDTLRSKVGVEVENLLKFIK